ncbi:MAG: alpha-ketoacid dehydrogenase subunit beta [Actinobacteria bacterium]|nr:alpha-ketoacid dehydrogenase subunit beta [Actinomycetota bacterium]
MAKMKYVEALREALRQEMQRDEKIYLIGEALGGGQQGVFRVTQGLQEQFGPDRVVDTPISEACIAGSAVGSAIFGRRPVAEIMFGNLMALCVDEFHNQAAKFHYLTDGMIKVPMVLRCVNWTRLVSGPHHCGTLDIMILNTPGIITVAPSTPADAFGLMKAALRQDNPVVYIEHSNLYSVSGEVPIEDKDYILPLGRANIAREGNDVTVVTYSLPYHDCIKAADELGKEGVSVELIDMRTLVPYDKQTIIKSVKKTGRIVVVYEGYKTYGAGSEICAMVAEEAIDYLEAPILRVALPDVPIAANEVMVKELSINENKVAAAVRKAME